MSPRLIMKLEIAALARDGDVLLVSLRHPRRPELPAFTPGAHVDLHLGDGRVRQYSLCGDPADRTSYRIAVKREAAGRGGSRWLHETLAPGGTLMTSAPRNHFELEPEADRTLLLAAGIGVTPILSMAYDLSRRGTTFAVHDFVRSRSSAQLLAELTKVVDPTRLHIHASDEPATCIALAELLARPESGTLIYCCGPPRFMDGVRDAAAHWPEDSVRFEAFQPLLDEDFVPAPFEIVVRSTGAVLSVPAYASALDVLRAAGIDLPSSCEIGVCGSCECGWLSGEPIHRDVVLSPRARRNRLIPCVSRAVGRLIVDV